MRKKLLVMPVEASRLHDVQIEREDALSWAEEDGCQVHFEALWSTGPLACQQGIL